MTEFKIKHQPEMNRFIIELPDDQVAQLSYRRLDELSTSERSTGNIIENKPVVDFHRTFIPEEYRGKGLAGLLVDKALKWAEDNDFEIETSCWYARLRVEKNTSRVRDTQNADQK